MGHADDPLLPGFVLHRTPFRESSLLLEVFTPSGRLGLVARGGRGKRSRIAAIVQPFVPLWLSWTGQGDLATLAHVELRPPPLSLTGRALFTAFYVNELLLRLTSRHDPQPELFEHYQWLLWQLVAGAEEWTLRRFEVVLLAELGYGLLLHCDGDGRPLRPDSRYCYHLERGPLPLQGEAPCPLTISGETLLALDGHSPPQLGAEREAKRLLRAVIHHHLGGRPLRSRELFRQMFVRHTDQGE